ncbi:fibronectin type III domain-containing protein [Candidatus Poriferisocius sp.]|uniref:fibronectin type III domain-containing protein n=1 Tax=Candidatus Poriferisocius sp. TaxID=3101276 RepID=UPI003B017122
MFHLPLFIPRFTISRLLLAAGLIAAGLAYTATTPAAAQLQTPPPVTNVTATAGDTEVTISWQYEQSQSCSAQGFFVRFKEETDADEGEVAVTGQLGSSTRSYAMGGLTPNTSYQVEVYAADHGSACKVYSAAAKVKVTTNASNSGSDPDAGNEAVRRTPRRVRNLTVSDSGTSATLTWAAPATPRYGGQCGHDGIYAVRLYNRTTGEEVKNNTYNPSAGSDTGMAYQGTALMVTVTGLTAGAKYKANVYAHGCGWSGARKVKWTQ